MPTVIKDLTGRIQGRLKVMYRDGKKGGITRWFCRCYCGMPTHYTTAELNHKVWPRQSCGACKDGVKYHREYHIWEGMRDRCNNPNRRSWPNYGGRGITVCSRWNDFLFFLEDVGLIPDSKNWTVERKNKDGHYEPNNCVWMLDTFQNLNRRKTNEPIRVVEKA
jgi:hypothetical protein